jgi:predicted GNAT family acetyltransferase
MSSEGEQMMIVKTFADAGAFLEETQAFLESNEALNGLMLGLAVRLHQFAARIQIPPYMATVTDDDEVVVVALMTPPHKLILASERPSPHTALTQLAHNLQAGNWPVPGVLGLSTLVEPFAHIWADLQGESFKKGMQQRVFELRQVTHPAYPTGQLRLAQANDVAIVTEWIQAFHEEALEPIDWTTAREMANGRIRDQTIYLWDNHQPVSMAAKTRPTHHGIAINLVYTPPEQRRQGYASAGVAALSQLLLDEGWQFCTLFTDLANPTSNSIYQKMGYVPVGDFNDYFFDSIQSE